MCDARGHLSAERIGVLALRISCGNGRLGRRGNGEDPRSGRTGDQHDERQARVVDRVGEHGGQIGPLRRISAAAMIPTTSAGGRARSMPWKGRGRPSWTGRRRPVRTGAGRW